MLCLCEGVTASLSLSHMHARTERERERDFNTMFVGAVFNTLPETAVWSILELMFSDL